jgi:hypothetical protein
LLNSCSWQDTAAEIITSTGGISVTSGNPVDSAVEESLPGSAISVNGGNPVAGRSYGCGNSFWRLDISYCVEIL